MLDAAEIDMAELRLKRGDQLGRLDVEAVKHILRFVVDFSRAAGKVALSRHAALQLGVADGGADGVRVGVFMSDNQGRLHNHPPDVTRRFAHGAVA